MRADATKGSQLAQQWCASCHVTSGNRTGNVQARTSELSNNRSAPEPPISCAPSYRIRMVRCRICRLTRKEIDDLVGYIETVR